MKYPLIPYDDRWFPSKSCFVDAQAYIVNVVHHHLTIRCNLRSSDIKIKCKLQSLSTSYRFNNWRLLPSNNTADTVMLLYMHGKHQQRMPYWMSFLTSQIYLTLSSRRAPARPSSRDHHGPVRPSSQNLCRVFWTYMPRGTLMNATSRNSVVVPMHIYSKLQQPFHPHCKGIFKGVHQTNASKYPPDDGCHPTLSSKQGGNWAILQANRFFMMQMIANIQKRLLQNKSYSLPVVRLTTMPEPLASSSLATPTHGAVDACLFGLSASCSATSSCSASSSSKNRARRASLMQSWRHSWSTNE